MVSTETYTHEGQEEPELNESSIKKQTGSWLKTNCITPKFRAKSINVSNKYCPDPWVSSRFKAAEMGATEAKQIRILEALQITSITQK